MADIPPDLRPRQERGRTKPTQMQIEAAYAKLDGLYRQHPDSPRIAGARAAAEWTTGRGSVSPITNVREPAVEPRLGWEVHEASMVEMGIKEGNYLYAAGAGGWLAWVTGFEPLPALLR